MWDHIEEQQHSALGYSMVLRPCKPLRELLTAAGEKEAINRLSKHSDGKGLDKLCENIGEGLLTYFSWKEDYEFISKLFYKHQP